MTAPDAPPVHPAPIAGRAASTAAMGGASGGGSDRDARLRAALRASSTVATCPCAGCRFEARCRDGRLACARMGMFLAGEPQRRWMAAPMAPTHSRFLALMT